MIRKDTKRTYLFYLPYECTAVEEYLEQMAEKGWLLQSVKGPLFKFKKTEPQKIKYSVDILDKTSIYDHKDTDIALEYREYCQVAGWSNNVFYYIYEYYTSYQLFPLGNKS